MADCVNTFDCGYRQDCYQGRCYCAATFGTVGPNCNVPTAGSYWIVFFSCFSFVCHSTVLVLHFRAIRDHFRWGESAFC
jgi:hypothetical protein